MTVPKLCEPVPPTRRSSNTGMTPSDVPLIPSAASCVPRGGRRGPDRRSGLLALLAHLVSGLRDGAEAGSLRHRLEEGLRRFVGAGRIELRDGAAPLLERSGAGDALVLEVPWARGRVVLDVVCDPGGRLDEWDVQVLQGAAGLAALALELDRARPAGALGPVRRAPRDAAAPLIGSSPEMRALRDRIERIAGTDFTVLIEGESGSGKELVARQLHELSRRRHGPFVAVNCAALVESLLEAELFGIEDRTATGVRGRRGKFEHADGGTLFLDEVSDLSASAQAKLLRAIQELAIERVGGARPHRVDVRIIAATNRRLSDLVTRNRFRADLYYRLSGVEVRVPPLRARREDIPELAAYFLARYRAVRPLRLSAAAADALVAYDWPGNVRELERVMERAVALAQSAEIGLDDLPPTISGPYSEILMPSIDRGDTLRAWASRYARLVWERCGRNSRQACRRLGISYHTLRAYLRSHRASSVVEGPGPETWVGETQNEEPVVSLPAESDFDRRSGS